MPAHRYTHALRPLAAFAVVLVVTACSATEPLPGDSVQLADSSVAAAPSESAMPAEPSTGASSEEPTDGGDPTTDINIEGIADFTPAVIVREFADCEVVMHDIDHVIWGCQDDFGVELSPTTVSLIVVDPENISPTAINRFSAAMAEAIGIADGGAGVAAAIEELTADQLAAPGSATVIEIAPDWEFSITGMADGATMFTAHGLTPER